MSQYSIESILVRLASQNVQVFKVFMQNSPTLQNHIKTTGITLETFSVISRKILNLLTEYELNQVYSDDTMCLTIPTTNPDDTFHLFEK